MLIQCQTCDSKYRLNLERIPERKTFIKCKKCNAPIYIDPREEQAAVPAAGPAAGQAGEAAAEAPNSGAEPLPAEGGEASADSVVVACGNCEARYRVPTQALRKAGLKLKCTRCGHTFPVPEGLAAPPEPAPETPDAGEAVAAPEFFPAAGQDDFPPSEAEEVLDAPQGPEIPATPEGLDGGEQPMPLPDDSRVDSMFDDLQVGEVAQAETELAAGELPGGVAAETEQAYLEAVTFGEAGREFNTPASGSIPDQQKYRFFMKPNAEGAPPAEAPPDEAPEGHVISEAGEMAASGVEIHPESEQEPPPISAEPSPGEVAAPEAAEAGPLEAPPFESEFPEETGMTEPTEIDPNLPTLTIEEPGQSHGANPAVPGQEPPPSRAENRNFLISSVLVFLVVALSVGWGFWIWSLPGEAEPFAVQVGTPQDFSVTSTKEGYFVTNKPSGKKLYVLTGKVRNGFSTGDRIGWVRLRGITYTNSGKATREGHTYVGNMLTDEQLATWELNAIQAYYGYSNGRDDINFEIPQGKAVPYQIVMPGVRIPVARAGTKVVSFMRKGRPVYLEHF